MSHQREGGILSPAEPKREREYSNEQLEVIAIVTGRRKGSVRCTRGTGNGGAGIYRISRTQPQPYGQSLIQAATPSVNRRYRIAACEAMVAETVSALVRRHACHQCGAFCRVGTTRLLEIDGDEWDKVMAINAGVFNCIKAAAP